MANDYDGYTFLRVKIGNTREKPSHRGVGRIVSALHLILAVEGEYGPRIQRHAVGPLLYPPAEASRG